MKNFKLKTKQSGVALAVGMILLLIVSVVGINSMKSAMLQEKMAGGLKNKEIADAAALSLMVQAEKWLYDYYRIGNGTIACAGSEFMVSPRSAEAIYFRNSRDLTTGFSYINGVSINSMYGGILADEPKFIIQPISCSSGGSSSSSGYAATSAESGGASAGSSNGSGSGDSASGAGRLLLFRIISKATDTTGNLFAAFESVMSVKMK